MRTGVPLAIAALAGVALWLAVSAAAGTREAWDTDAYWKLAYPVAVLLSAALGFAFPQRAWRWPAVLFLSQFLTMLLSSGEVGSLWPLGLALFAVLAVPAVVAAQFGARMKVRQAQ